jgi:tRNA-specific 2-thiouridylase
LKRVVVGLSGGVDSSVAAYLLKEEGYEVIGIFMRNWNDESAIIADECPWIEDSNDALLVAEKLGIPFQTIDFSVEYKERIVDYMFHEYEAGRTPNPDVLCNREVKFDLFLKKALELNADFVATGHYCQKESFSENGKTIYRLLAGKDKSKDQSYFLCQVNQEQLSKALFPIGHLLKSEVRKIASEQGFITAEKKDSQGLCFIGKVKLPDFLQQQLQTKEGNIVQVNADNVIYNRDWDNEKIELLAKKYPHHKSIGKKIGTHQGAHFYTVGQRKGLGVGGTTLPLFVIDSDVKENIVYVGLSTEHPGLYRKVLKILNKDVHWIREDIKLNEGEKQTLSVRIRYRQDLCKAELIQKKDALYIVFQEMQRGITPGQFAAWYFENELLGSGVID